MSARDGLLALLLLALTACSSAAPPADGAIATDASGADAALASPCPAAMPAQGAACTRDALECSYGTDPRVECRTLARCTGGAWVLTSQSCSGPVSSADCPAQAPANNSSCGGDGGFVFQACYYADGTRCFCNGVGGATMYRCTFPEDPRCPASAVPNRGEGCAGEGADCNYGLCGDGTHLRCSNGIWVNVPAPCTR